MRRRRSLHADDVDNNHHVDLVYRYVDIDHRYVQLDNRHIEHHNRYVDHHQRDDDHHVAGSGGPGLDMGPPASGSRVRSGFIRCRGARWRAALIGLTALVVTASSLPAQTIRLDFSLTVRQSADSVHISCAIVNVGRDPAYEIEAELRAVDTTPRPVTGELRPGERTEVTWTVNAERWRTTLREIAAVRIRYHDAAGVWASGVMVLGQEAEARVEGLGWPVDSLVEVTWEEPAGTGRAAWWGPDELEMEGDRRWSSRDGTATVQGRLEPATDITGWETMAFLLVLPDDASSGRIVPVPIDARSFRSLWRPDYLLLAIWAGLCVAVWMGAAAVLAGVRARLGVGPSPLASRRSRLLATSPAFATALCLGTAALMIFPPRLLLLDTTPAGGDYASHIVALDQLREVLLPSGQVFGWSMDQYAGFPLFLFYFPLAFLVIVLLSVALPLTVAMKIGSLAGALLLPVAWYLSLRWLGAPRPARWLAPAAALAFLLVETQAAWGGNLPSLLAGEFAYALGLPLAWLAATWAWRTRDRVAGWWPAAVLLALAGLAHGYALVCAAIGIALLALHPRLWWRRCWHVARIGLAAFGLLAWWLVPLLWNLPWTTGFREQWEIGGIGDLFPPVIAIATVVLIAGVAWRLISRSRPVLAPGQIWLLGFAVVLFVFYRLGFSLGVVDVRFLPMMHGALLLAGCYELGAWIARARPRLRPALVTVVIVIVSTAALATIEYIPSWVRWNMGGMERTAGWPDFHGAMRAIAGGIGEPRVAWEHHPDHNEAGTIRAFEMIPWFADRATLEGLYFQSSVLAPPIFYLQSEISLHPSCPLPAFECGRFDPAAAVPHLELLGASELIAYTDTLTRSLERLPDFEARARSGVYEVFALVDPPSLVEPVAVRPVVDTWPAWQAEAYDWFRAGTDLDVPLVLSDAENRQWASVDRYRPGRLPRIDYATTPVVSATIRDQEIRIETDTPGHPLLVKVGYNPGWRASDGSTIDLVAPGMMLVTPRSTSFTLEWSSGWAGRGGLLLTAVTLIALVVGVTRRRRSGDSPGLRLPEANRAGWIGIAALAVLAVATALVMLRRHPPLDHAALLAEGQRHLSDGRLAEADESFQRMLSVDTPHTLRDDAAFYRALVALEAGDNDLARRRLESFLQRFPVSTYRAEVLVRLSDLHVERGAVDRAREALEEARVTPLAPENWPAAASERLERLKSPAVPSEARS